MEPGTRLSGRQSIRIVGWGHIMGKVDRHAEAYPTILKPWLSPLEIQASLPAGAGRHRARGWQRCPPGLKGATYQAGLWHHPSTIRDALLWMAHARYRGTRVSIQSRHGLSQFCNLIQTFWANI
jgi:hypothetical protein